MENSFGRLKRCIGFAAIVLRRSISTLPQVWQRGVRRYSSKWLVYRWLKDVQFLTPFQQFANAIVTKLLEPLRASIDETIRFIATFNNQGSSLSSAFFSFDRDLFLRFIGATEACAASPSQAVLYQRVPTIRFIEIDDDDLGFTSCSFGCSSSIGYCGSRAGTGTNSWISWPTSTSGLSVTERWNVCPQCFFFFWLKDF